MSEEGVRTSLHITASDLVSLTTDHGLDPIERSIFESIIAQHLNEFPDCGFTGIPVSTINFQKIGSQPITY
jgi:hypothetical protein